MDYPSAPWYSVHPDALGANDGEYDMGFVAAHLHRASRTATGSRPRSPAASLEATFVSDVDITMAEDGGTGYNVIATLPGKQKNGQMVILNAHHDAHFRAGLDDTGAVVATLAAAKAMKMSGYQPNRDHQVRVRHRRGVRLHQLLVRLEHRRLAPDHPGATRTGSARSPPCGASSSWRPRAPRVDINTSPELVPLARLRVRGRPRAGIPPTATTIETPQSTWQNGWSFMASGVPSFEISAGGADYGDMYHSTYEAYDKVDWDMTRPTIDQALLAAQPSSPTRSSPAVRLRAPAPTTSRRALRRGRARRGRGGPAAASASTEQGGRAASAAGATKFGRQRHRGRRSPRPGIAQLATMLKAAKKVAQGHDRPSTPGTTPATRTSRRCGTSSTWTRRASPTLAGRPRGRRGSRPRTLASVGAQLERRRSSRPSVVPLRPHAPRPGLLPGHVGRSMGKLVNHFDMTPVMGADRGRACTTRPSPGCRRCAQPT